MQTVPVHDPSTFAARDTWRAPRRPVLGVSLARTADDVEAAQRLRFRVFNAQFGARFKGTPDGLDNDIFDRWCHHLVVRDEQSAEVVGTYRILTPESASRLGTFYSETEFDLTRIARHRTQMCELGRACIDPRYRDGATLMKLWQGLAAFLRARDDRYLIGSVSIGLSDGGANARAVWRHIAQQQPAPIEYQVFARRQFDVDAAEAESAAPAVLPALLKAYLRLGAWVSGAPAYDPDFNCADVFMFMPIANLDGRYARHYLKAA